MTPSPRCFLCGARALSPTDRSLVYPSGHRRAFPLACASCGVLVEADADPGEAVRHLARAMKPDAFTCAPDAPYGLDAYTLRMAATRWHRHAVPGDDAQAEALAAPHSERAAAARLAALRPGGELAISLGLLCRPDDVDRLVEALAPHRAWARGIVLLVDDEPAKQGTSDGFLRIARRWMAGDFAAQRNALQDLSPTPWMMQLDADETLDEETGTRLPTLAALAEEGGVVSVGLARRNLVDGVLSDLWPDTQYRLNRREVRFENRVHERPLRPWQRSLIALCGAIDHHLDRAHVETRSHRYEALSPGRGQGEEEAALLQPFRP